MDSVSASTEKLQYLMVESSARADGNLEKEGEWLKEMTEKADRSESTIIIGTC